MLLPVDCGAGAMLLGKGADNELFSMLRDLASQRGGYENMVRFYIRCLNVLRFLSLEAYNSGGCRTICGCNSRQT